MEAINAHRRIALPSTVVDGRYTLRVCAVSHRTHRDRIDEALEIIATGAARVVKATQRGVDRTRPGGKPVGSTRPGSKRPPKATRPPVAVDA